MPASLDQQLAQIDPKRLREALRQAAEQIQKTLDGPDDSLIYGAETALTLLTFNSHELGSGANLLPLLSQRLVDIVMASIDDLTATVNPAVQQLRRASPLNLVTPSSRSASSAAAATTAVAAAPAPVDPFIDLLDGSEGYTPYALGDLIVAEVPYLTMGDLTLDPAPPPPPEVLPPQLNQAILTGQGGEFVGNNELRPWRPRDPTEFWQTIPHPGDVQAGQASKTWYFLTGTKPADLPNPIPPNFSRKADLRNVVKTLEIEYSLVSNPNGLDSGEFIVTTTTTVGSTTTTTTAVTTTGTVGTVHTTDANGNPVTIVTANKVKPPHIIVCYAGGNGT